MYDSFYSRGVNDPSNYRDPLHRNEQYQSSDNISCSSSDRARQEASQAPVLSESNSTRHNPYQSLECPNRRYGHPADRRHATHQRRRHTTPDRNHQRRHADYDKSSSQQASRASHQPTPRRRGRRIQDDFCWAPRGNQQPSTFAQYRWAHQNTSPDSIHLRYQYRSPGQRFEDRINAVCVEVTDLWKELRIMREPGPHSLRPRPSETTCRW